MKMIGSVNFSAPKASFGVIKRNKNDIENLDPQRLVREEAMSLIIQNIPGDKNCDELLQEMQKSQVIFEIPDFNGIPKQYRNIDAYERASDGLPASRYDLHEGSVTFRDDNPRIPYPMTFDTWVQNPLYTPKFV